MDWPLFGNWLGVHTVCRSFIGCSDSGCDVPWFIQVWKGLWKKYLNHSRQQYLMWRLSSWSLKSVKICQHFACRLLLVYTWVEEFSPGNVGIHKKKKEKKKNNTWGTLCPFLLVSTGCFFSTNPNPALFLRGEGAFMHVCQNFSTCWW